MSSPILIHLSDLHISDHSGNFNEPNKNSLLSSDFEAEANTSFINTFISFVKSDFPQRDISLLVTGDISNIAEEIEFEGANYYISKIISELNIDKSKVLLLPGDHDVHRDSIKNLIREKNGVYNQIELNEAKFRNFSKFYLNILGKNFSSNDIIVDEIKLTDKLILIGLNSNLSINQHGGHGYIDSSILATKIKEVQEKYPNAEIAVAFHHNISGMYEDKQSGQWDFENRKYVVETLNENNVKIVLYGNEHTPRSAKFEDLFYISESGAFSGTTPLGTFRIYEILETEDKIVLLNNLFQLISIKTVLETSGGIWNPIKPPSRLKTEIDEFVIFDNTNLIAQTQEEPLEIPKSTQAIQGEINEQPVVPNKIYDGVYSQKIYEIIKRKKLFHSGHFHWSETSRAHNWIDVTKLLEDRDDLFEVKSSIIDVIEKFELHKDCDLIIGLGYEGNIISSKVSIKYNIPYSSLPYSYRYNDHHKFEKQLYFENTDGKYKKVLIITDVVNDGRTIRKLIKKDNREKIFFENVEKINVVSLFYSGDRPLNIDVLNTKGKSFSKDYDLENDYPDVDNIDYYTVAKLKVEKCPYSNGDYKEACLIYKDKLDCVHLFYDEEKK
jgi:orotate phosphoribosyltransferase/UDP-2,3-diacylglucosamine pyrophosphatase LpxH